MIKSDSAFRSKVTHLLTPIRQIRNSQNQHPETKHHQNVILKTYSRIFTEDLNATLQVLKPFIGREPELRVKFQDMEVATLGDFCFLAGPKESMKPFLGIIGPVIVDDLETTQSQLERSGAEITQPITEAPTGWSLFSRDSQGVVIEWVRWSQDVWDQVNAAVSAAGK